MGLFYSRLTKEESNHKNIIKIRSLSNRFNKAIATSQLGTNKEVSSNELTSFNINQYVLIS